MAPNKRKQKNKAKMLKEDTDKKEKQNTNVHQQLNVPLNSEVKLSFLSSLSSSSELTKCDPEAIIYKQEFQKNKDALISVLFKLFNEEVFDNKLPADFKIVWNPRLRSCAGTCFTKTVTVTNHYKNYSKKTETFLKRMAYIQLATKIITTAERLRDTLLHELCHAAGWIMYGSKSHNKEWKMLTIKAVQKFPELPYLKRCHSFEMEWKWEYKCTGCSNSLKRVSRLNLARKRCGYCYAELKLIVDETKKKKLPRKPSKWTLYLKENFKRVKQDNPSLTYGEIMKLLGSQYAITKNDL